MFIGHWAPAFAAAAVSKNAPKLGTLFIAAQLVDWGFFLFAIIGVEKMRIEPGITAMNPLDLYHMPFTHSLVGTLAWAFAFLVLLLLLKRQFVTAGIAALVVASHWLIDLLVHRPDLTIAGGEARYGFGLWNYPAAAIALELGITLAAFLWYVAKTKGPVMPPWILLAFLLMIQSINWFGPQPIEASFMLYAMALISFGLAAWIASWVGTTRRHVDDRGLAGGGPRR
ncbi:hypothetical protein QWY75_04795 [Pontixanthobacter aestiaquae]|uniref:Uncharacterized protein n=1 Tax=Pontixanthobacter aestiaquae TaxID=1509367 RepID=A0A844Z8B7_9SPHN|nr:hypothetical protein [Pontixanthobacter aestiaquae]MDN3645526.1 hypothetical protein [Pontixanthobacter aestiaquae]MXO83476.1 hypothetical protein [Pontixanthobacter aestiaquae]